MCIRDRHGLFFTNLKVGDLLGAGGFGQVHLASRGEGHDPVAVKFLPQRDDVELKNFREASLLSRLAHPNILKFIACGETVFSFASDSRESALWIATEYLDGDTLADARARKSQFKEPHLAFIAASCLKALSLLHKENVVHRDLKTDNVMLTLRGHVKLIDFGLAEDVSTPVTSICGTPHYIAPELIRLEPYTTQPDIWSLGIMLLELAYNLSPSELFGNSLVYLTRIGISGISPTLEFSAARPFKFSRDFIDFVSACLTFSPQDRPSALTLLNHKWLSCACNREKIREVVDKLFVRQSLKDMGLNLY